MFVHRSISMVKFLSLRGWHTTNVEMTNEKQKRTHHRVLRFKGAQKRNTHKNTDANYPPVHADCGLCLCQFNPWMSCSQFQFKMYTLQRRLHLTQKDKLIMEWTIYAHHFQPWRWRQRRPFQFMAKVLFAFLIQKNFLII